MGEELNDDVISDSQESSLGIIIYEDGNLETSINDRFLPTSVSPHKNNECYNRIDISEAITQPSATGNQEDPIRASSTTKENTGTGLINGQTLFEGEDYVPRRMLRKRTAIQKCHIVWKELNIDNY